MVSVKICGLTSESDLESALRAGADRVGFVLVPKSPRFVDGQRALSMARHAKGRAEVWLVTSWTRSGAPNQTDMEDVVGELKAVGVQLHGKETPEDVAAFKQLAPHAAVVKAIGIATRQDLEQARAFAAADMFLLDAKPPPGADREGGHGKPFDWSILQGFDPGKPWVLSGGLTPENVAEAIRVSGAKAVDVSSGVEARPGVKDPAKVAAFIRAAKGA